MELRSYNVEHIYMECVKCRIGDEIGIDKVKLKEHTDDIKDMCNQIARVDNNTILTMANTRKDDETWTPYLQIVEMLILLGEKIGVVKFNRPLNETTKIEFI